jgi:hypothetical protein
MPETNPNVFRITTQYCDDTPRATVACSPTFTFQSSARMIRSWRNVLRFLCGHRFSIRLTLECTDPELTALIDAYTKKKALEWQGEQPEEPQQPELDARQRAAGEKA